MTDNDNVTSNDDIDNPLANSTRTFTDMGQQSQLQSQRQQQQHHQEDKASLLSVTTANLSKTTSNYFLHQQQLRIHPEFHYNKHNESIFDDEKLFPCLSNVISQSLEDIVRFDEADHDLINAATLKALIVQLTSPEHIDYNLICDFFLTFRMFSSSNEIMDLLLTRLIWALQYINTNSEPNVRIGKLVLLRTFVVLRHWIINYFVDDFDSNTFLCETFSNTLNKITIESNLIRQDDNHLDQTTIQFITKILGDLKIHWLKLVDEFYNLNLDLDTIIANKQHILLYRLPETFGVNKHKITKSSTEMSIHTNPSYRRSAMLSLYDLKTHHKMLIYDNNPSNTNENHQQFSMKNLLMHHQSSSISINNKLLSIQKENKKEPGRFPHDRSNTPPPINSRNAIPDSPVTPTRSSRRDTHKRRQGQAHNYLNIKDSALDLKRTKNIEQLNGNEDQDNAQQLMTTPTRSPIDGFSTNGNIKLPSSKISTIVPPTPAKKMDVIVLDPTSAESTPRSTKQLWQPPSGASILETDSLSSKGSIKKLVEGWKKTIKHEKLALNESKSLSTTTQNENINKLITNAINVMGDTDISNRFDVMSARITDELEYLIRQYITSENNTTNTSTIEEKDDMPHPQENPLPNRGLSVAESDDLFGSEHGHDDQLLLNLHSEHQHSSMDINDLSELNIKKIDNLINDNDQTPQSNGQSKETIVDQAINSNGSSFQKAASINWNDDGNLDLENSHERSNAINDARDDELDKLDDLEIAEEVDLDDFNFQVCPYRNEIGSSNHSVEHASTISTPSNMSQYDVDIADLGITVSPHRKNPQRVSFTDQLSREYSRRHSRFSTARSLVVRESFKSYISYDSAFSYSNESSESTNVDHMNGNGLRKKNAFNNLQTLKKDLEWPAIIPTNSTLSSSTFEPRMNKRSTVRLSVLRALSELPFNQASIIQEETRSFSTNNSLFSSSAGTTNQRISPTAKGQSHGNSVTTPRTTKNSVAIPGISSDVLKELAAIPDEAFHFTNPIEFTFLKLEGKSNASSKLTLCAQTPTPTPAELIKEEGREADVQELENEEETLENSKDINNVPQNENADDFIDQIHHIDTEDATGLTSFDTSHEEVPLNARSNSSAKQPTNLLTPVASQDDLNSDDEPVTSTPNHDNTISNFTPQFNTADNLSSFYASPLKLLEAYHPSSDVLSVEYVIRNGTHISFILSYDSVSLAEHFTIIEKDMIKHIDWKDLIELKWKRDLTPATSWLEMIVNNDYFDSNTSVNLVIARFNLMVNWIISEVVLTVNQQERINIISRFIHIAQNCYSMQNYSTLMQIILALTGEKVQKLRGTWRNLPPGDILMLKNLEKISLPIKNFLNLRLSINQMSPSKGCIPFVGLYLSDLTFNAERPSVIKKESNSIIGTTLPSDDYIVMDEDLINFSKFRTAVHIVKSLSQCIEWSSAYKFKIQLELLSKCLYIKSLDEEEMNYCLGALERT